MRRRVIYTETVPRNERFSQSGLDVLLDRIFIGQPYSDKCLLVNNVYGEHFTTEVLPSTFTLNQNLFIANKEAPHSRLGRTISILTGNWHTNEIDSFLDDGDDVFFVIGADADAILRVTNIIKRCGIRRYSLYFIDLPLESLEQRNFGKLRKFLYLTSLSRLITGSAAVFAFTSKLKEKLEQEYRSGNIFELKLPYYSTELSRHERDSVCSDEIFYLGSVNYLYRDPLQTVSKAISIMNSSRSDGRLTLRTTQELVNASGTDIITNRIEDETLLNATIANAAACLVVYSADAQHASVVNFTFPSKFLRYLPYARRVIYFGPPDTEFVRVCKSKSALVTFCFDYKGLEKCLFDVMRHPEIPDQQSALDQRQELAGEFSIEKFADTLKTIDVQV